MIILKLKKFLLHSIHIALLTAGGCIAILLLLPALPFREPFVSYSVISGSMEPLIPAGSVVLVRQNHRANVGDIAAFYAPDVSGEIIIHRIINTTEQAGTVFFQTKGDNNTAVDTWLVHPSNIIGSVQITIPWIASLQVLLREPIWFLLLVGIPLFYTSYRCCLLIFDGINDRKKHKQKNHFTALALILFSSIFTFFLVLPYSPARSLYSATSTISNISLSTAALYPTPTQIPQPSGTPTPTKKPGGTVIIISDNGEGSENEVIIENTTEETDTSITSTTTQTSSTTTVDTGNNTIKD